ncbi:MAG: sulfotransferase domain-containing protein, partial [Spartobacteria bacterium]
MFLSSRRKIDKLDFILIGAQKSGTTALHYYLQKHRRICLGDQQEMHFFDEDKIFAAPSVDYGQLHRHFPRIGRSTIAGECTPSYLYCESAAQRIHDYNPQIKLLVLLRNPIERAFAHWNMQRFKGREPLDFFEAVKSERTRLSGAPFVVARSFAYVDRGFYARQLDRFFQFFPREQVKAVKSEEFKNAPRE